MTAGLHSPNLEPDPVLLDDLLHSLSQPLTSLRCSLELSVDEDAQQQQQSISAALQQTETVIAMISLMREYLDADSSPANYVTELAPALRSVAADLSSIAAARDVQLRVEGVTDARICVAKPQLRRALQYLILAILARAPAHSRIELLLDQPATGTLLRVRANLRHCRANLENRSPKLDHVQETIRRVRVAIAFRILQTAGATLVFDYDAPEFVLQVPAAISTAV